MQSRRNYRRQKLKELIDEINKLDMKVQRLENEIEEGGLLDFQIKSKQDSIEKLNQEIDEKKELAASLMAFREQSKKMNGNINHSAIK